MLNEEKIKSADKKLLLSLIDSPKNTKFILKTFASDYDEDEREVDVVKTKKGVKFMYSYDFDLLTTTLVDLCDDLNRHFKTDIEKSTNTMYFKVE